MGPRLCRAVAAGCGALILAATPPAAASGTTGAPDRDAIRSIIVAEARNMSLAPQLALAVAHAESFFDPAAESRKGARGVMQIMPATAIGEYGIHPDRLWDPRINIRLGIHFLKRLLQRYQGDKDLALSYYNGGADGGNLPSARVIPATYGYVRRVRSLELYYLRTLRSGGDRRWTNVRR